MKSVIFFLMWLGVANVIAVVGPSTDQKLIGHGYARATQYTGDDFDSSDRPFAAYPEWVGVTVCEVKRDFQDVIMQEIPEPMFESVCSFLQNLKETPGEDPATEQEISDIAAAGNMHRHFIGDFKQYLGIIESLRGKLTGPEVQQFVDVCENVMQRIRHFQTADEAATHAVTDSDSDDGSARSDSWLQSFITLCCSSGR